MPIHRDARQSRRRRLLRDGTDVEAQLRLNPGEITSRRAKKSDEQEQPTRRSAGYSQDVRSACNQRLVQLIPVRVRSLVGVMAVCCAVPSLLMLAHYMVYVSGQWPWYGHPLALSLDASHPQGLAAWFSSHLWLLCLGTTLLTFQLRRHKLDDYRGEYRLWFWLVITCLLGSLDATTHLSQAFATAMDPACRRMLGWSGGAVMQSTLLVLIGMLGLRLCTELKVVPLSLCLWLMGLAAWAGSAALSRNELRLEEMSLQFRIWARCAFWLCGLTFIWLAGLVYLRHVYIDAQRRFLLRGKLANSAMNVPISQRVRGAWEALPAIPRFRKGNVVEEEPVVETRKPRRAVKSPAIAVSGSADVGEAVVQMSPAPPLGGTQADANSRPSRRGWTQSWFRSAKDNDDAAEYHKVANAERPKPQQHTQADEQAQASEPAEGKRGWLPRIPRPSLSKLPKVGVPKVKVPKVSMPKVSLPRVSMPKMRMPKVKLPSFGLGGLRLKPPPDEDGSASTSSSADQSSTAIAGKPSAKAPNGLQPIDPRKPLPGTSANAPSAAPSTPQPSQASRQISRDDDGEDDEDYAQPMSKAERKRLKRQQQQQNRAA